MQNEEKQLKKKTPFLVIELAPGDYLELLIQDDLTGLDSFSMMAQGHFND